MTPTGGHATQDTLDESAYVPSAQRMQPELPNVGFTLPEATHHHVMSRHDRMGLTPEAEGARRRTFIAPHTHGRNAAKSRRAALRRGVEHSIGLQKLLETQGDAIRGQLRSAKLVHADLRRLGVVSGGRHITT